MLEALQALNRCVAFDVLPEVVSVALEADEPALVDVPLSLELLEQFEPFELLESLQPLMLERPDPVVNTVDEVVCVVVVVLVVARN
mmetsp:Transcript_18497/g.32827  ORF Transcript_18497/g.32827 Transcript_18497/m.32827 type:complete len:86 (-) Transcript_18497:3849-4106(-)